MKRALALLFVLGLWLATALPMTATAQSGIPFPALTGRVVDQADILTPDQERALSDKLAALETRTTDQLVVVTVASLNDYDISEYGYQLGRAWGIGQKEANNGALLIVAPNDRKVRIEVGYGLEGVLTDAYSSIVIRNDILPSFREGNFYGGIDKGVDALVYQMTLDPDDAAARAAKLVEEDRGDAGNASALLIGGAVLFGIFILLGAVAGAASGGRGRRVSGAA
ncbi:TPM domain-containing protein, partial [Brevundimonas sp.]|uniref:TPM domain-containing protein n=2 Tax=unclassified Brevundimonas TaxID=2622653 RepID=UPI0028A0FE02